MFDVGSCCTATGAVARGLRKTTIAECVEDRQTLDMLRRFGVDNVQGFFLERPHGDHRRSGHVTVVAIAGGLGPG